MPTDPTPVSREEFEALRAEHEALKKKLRRLLSLLDIDKNAEPKDWPEWVGIEAHHLAVRDDPLRIPLQMYMAEHGARLVFNDEKMRERLALSFTEEGGPRLEMRNAAGKLIFQVAEAADGSGQACVCDAEGRPRAGLRVNQFGGVVNVLDAEAKPRAALLSGAEGGEIFVVNCMHHAGVSLKALADGGLVTVSEASGQVMGFFKAGSETGSLSVYGPHGAMAVSLGGSEAGGAVVFYDVEGEATGHLPE